MKKSLFYPALLCLPLLWMDASFAKLTPLYFRDKGSNVKFIFFDPAKTSPLDMVKQAPKYVDCDGAHGFNFMVDKGLKKFFDPKGKEEEIKKLKLKAYSREKWETYFSSDKPPDNPAIDIPLTDFEKLYGLTKGAYLPLKAAFENPLQKTPIKPDNDQTPSKQGRNSTIIVLSIISLVVIAGGVIVYFYKDSVRKK